MQLTKPLLGELFARPVRYKIPIFQRDYVWDEEEQLQPLWDDFLNKVNERKKNHLIHPHYTGAIVLAQENVGASNINTFNVIDGQQRLTTFQLFISAYREVCRLVGDGHANLSKLIVEIDKNLINEKKWGMSDKEYLEQKFRMKHNPYNRDTFNFILSNTHETIVEKLVNQFLDKPSVGKKTYLKEAKKSDAILRAYLFFFEKIKDFFEEEADFIQTVQLIQSTLMQDFQFVEISLDKDDDPQIIFETMNGRGASLTEMDLIRNYVFMRNKDPKNTDDIYREYWDEFDSKESLFKWKDEVRRGRTKRCSYLEFFMIDYLTLKLMFEIRADQTFFHYKSFINNFANFTSIEEELAELKKYAEVFKKVLCPNTVSPFGRLCYRLQLLDMTTMNALLLFIEGHDQLTNDDKSQYYQYLDSYVTRRFICGLTSKNYNLFFLSCIKFIQGNPNPIDFHSFLNEREGDTSAWPSDGLVRAKILSRPIYQEEIGKRNMIKDILLSIESSLSSSKSEKIIYDPSALTIEHMMPQSWSEHWPLGDQKVSAEDIDVANTELIKEDNADGYYHRVHKRNEMIQSFGNLTLITGPLNSSVNNGTFGSKKEELATHSKFHLNSYFSKLSHWSEIEIQTRGNFLADKIIQIWQR